MKFKHKDLRIKKTQQSLKDTWHTVKICNMCKERIYRMKQNTCLKRVQENFIKLVEEGNPRIS